VTRPAPTDSILRDPGGLVFARELPEGASILDCLQVAWDEARWEARCTYDEWHWNAGVDAYFIYRAAQDRADAAQDALAQITRAQASYHSL
jgi:hypothetical protein